MLPVDSPLLAVYDPRVKKKPPKIAEVGNLPEPSDEFAANLAPRPQERLLLDWLRGGFATKNGPVLATGKRLLCNTVGRGQFAAQMARDFPTATVDCHFFDLFSQQLVAGEQATEDQQPAANLTLHCAADLPTGPVDSLAWFISQRGEAELARDSLQDGHDKLKIGGWFWAVTDNSADQWLYEQMQPLFSKVTRLPLAEGVIYQAIKTAPLKKRRDFSCEFPTKSGERWLRLRTRPGVFSHRHVDPGARVLIHGFQTGQLNDFDATDLDAPPQPLIQPGMKVLDLGCGCGVVGLMAAMQAENVRVVCADSHTRAIESVQWGIEQNGLSGVTAVLDCNGTQIETATFDLALLNPPYFANFRIAEHFVRTSHRSLRPGGKVLIVTKTPQWYLDFMPALFENVQSVPVKNYVLVSGERK